MPPLHPFTALKLVPYFAAALVVKVTLSVVLNYRNYLPPNFDSDFLFGREAYFFGGYQGAFYTHLVSGPISLLLGLLLISTRFRQSFPRWHRWLGKVQVVNVLLLLTPSGLWMAFYAEGGVASKISFVVLAFATAFCTFSGWRSAVKRKFLVHQQWMWRSFLLLCSDVMLRLMVGLTIVLDFSPPWITPAIAWACWLLPLLVYEVYLRANFWRASRSQTVATMKS